MAKRLVFLVTSLLTVAPAWAGTKTVRFVEKDRGFAMEIPADWEKHQGDYGAALIALSPLEGNKDSFRENVNVVVEDLSSTMATKDYYKASQELMKKAFNEFKVEKTGVTRLNGTEFHWTLFVHRIGTLRARVLQHIAVSGKRAYVVTASAMPDKFNKYKPAFDATIASFRITGSSGLAGGPTPASTGKKGQRR